MIPNKTAKPILRGTAARLLLNGKDVGAITIRGSDNAWSYGDFTPAEAFGEFATVFGQWSLLMHADGDASPLSRPASDELRRMEYLLDSLRAKILILDTGEIRRAAQVNIDGPLIEWKDA